AGASRPRLRSAAPAGLQPALQGCGALAKRLLRQEQLQQIVEEQLALRGGYQTLGIGAEQTSAFRLPARLVQLAQIQAGTLAKQRRRHAPGQAQGIHQELEWQLVRRQYAAAGLEGLLGVQIILGQAGI